MVNTIEDLRKTLFLDLDAFISVSNISSIEKNAEYSIIDAFSELMAKHLDMEVNFPTNEEESITDNTGKLDYTNQYDAKYKISELLSHYPYPDNKDFMRKELYHIIDMVYYSNRIYHLSRDLMKMELEIDKK